MDKLCQETTMRMHEITSEYDEYFDKSKMNPEVYSEITSALSRRDEASLTPEMMHAMYHPESAREELELRQLRLDIEKTQAEIKRLRATADRDHAEARRLQSIAQNAEEK